MSTHENGHAELVKTGPTAMISPHQTAAVAVAAQVAALVKARYELAVMQPRDIDAVRVKLLKECKRPGFADAAIYSKPVGGKSIEGLSIRFAEAAARIMGNLDVQTPVVFEDDEKRIVRCLVVDLEANTGYHKDIVIQKTVERRNLRQGQRPIRTRINSAGEPVHLVEATEEDLANKQGASESKAMRTNILRLVPGDIQEECRRACEETLQNRAAQDPDAERRRVADAFASLNVMPDQLREYLGHDLGTCTPAELVRLRGLFQAIRDGEATWASAMEQAHGERKPAEKPSAPPSDLNAAAEKAKAARSKKPAQAEVPVEPVGEREPGSDDE